MVVTSTTWTLQELDNCADIEGLNLRGVADVWLSALPLTIRRAKSFLTLRQIFLEVRVGIKEGYPGWNKFSALDVRSHIRSCYTVRSSNDVSRFSA